MLSWLEETYSFDDVLLVPNFSNIKSRRDSSLNLSTNIGNIKLDIPIISANMDSVTEINMAKSMRECRGLGIFHRFYKSKDKYQAQIKEYQIITKELPFLSIGIKTQQTEIDEISNLLNSDKLNLCLDIANADNFHVHEYIKELLKNNKNINLIVGNICTGDAALRLFDLGVINFKCGIGPGAACTTRIMTGCGVPQISAIANIKKALCTRDLCNQNKYHIIADGGIKNSGDIVKALAVGANSVMIGKILASCDESPSSIIHSNGHNYKEYRGQSSYEFQKDNNIYRCDITPEGESFLIDSSGPVKSTLDLLVGGIKSGMSYLGVNNITELYEQSKFVKISQAGLNESKPHGKN